MTLIEATRATFRRLHRSPRTEEAYLRWIRDFIGFHDGRHPRELGATEITAFLNHLAIERHTSASTQNQALCAIVFLYKRVLDLDIPTLDGLERAQRPEHPPTVLCRGKGEVDRPALLPARSREGPEDPIAIVRARHEPDRGPLGVVSPLDR